MREWHHAPCSVMKRSLVQKRYDVWLVLLLLQVRTLPDVRVVTDVHGGVSLPPGSRFEVEVEVQPASYGIICTLVMLDFGRSHP